MRRKVIVYASGILILLSALWLLLPGYMQLALIHQKPGILDYRIFSNNIVHTGKGLSWQVDEDYNAIPIEKKAHDEFEKYRTVAFLVIKDGKLLHEEYWDGWSDSTISNSFSMAKSIVSLLIGCLADDGLIAMDDPVHKYIPELQDMKDHPVLIRDLLTMSSGLAWDESYSSLTSITTKAYYGNDIRGLVTGLKPDEEPGRIFRYKSCNTQLLATIVARVSGMSISDYASLKLWQPLGAENKAIWSLDRKNGNEKAYCCFNATGRDFARIGQMVLDSGTFNGQQVVSKSYIALATTPATWLKDEDGGDCSYYGYHFWLTTHNGYRVSFARGILGQYIFVIPELNTVIVRLGHKRSKEYKDFIPDDAYVYLDEGIRLSQTQKKSR